MHTYNLSLCTVVDDASRDTGLPLDRVKRWFYRKTSQSRRSGMSVVHASRRQPCRPARSSKPTSQLQFRLNAEAEAIYPKSLSIRQEDRYGPFVQALPGIDPNPSNQVQVCCSLTCLPVCLPAR